MDFIKGIVALAESHPLGFLVAAMVVAILWLVRRVEALNKERQTMAQDLFRAQSAGHEVDESTVVVLNKLNRRGEVPTKLDRRERRRK